MMKNKKNTYDHYFGIGDSSSDYLWHIKNGYKKQVAKQTPANSKRFSL